MCLITSRVESYMFTFHVMVNFILLILHSCLVIHRVVCQSFFLFNYAVKKFVCLITSITDPQRCTLIRRGVHWSAKVCTGPHKTVLMWTSCISFLPLRFFNTMSMSSSNARNRLQVARVFVKDDVNNCDCDVPAKERTCWKLTNPNICFWNCNNSLVNFDLAWFVNARFFRGSL